MLILMCGAVVAWQYGRERKHAVAPLPTGGGRPDREPGGVGWSTQTHCGRDVRPRLPRERQVMSLLRRV